MMKLEEIIISVKEKKRSAAYVEENRFQTKEAKLQAYLFIRLELILPFEEKILCQCGCWSVVDLIKG